MVPLRMRILGGLGDPLGGLFLHTHGWMLALGLKVGITGTNLRMRGMPVSTSTGTGYFFVEHILFIVGYFFHCSLWIIWINNISV